MTEVTLRSTIATSESGESTTTLFSDGRVLLSHVLVGVSVSIHLSPRDVVALADLLSTAAEESARVVDLGEGGGKEICGESETESTLGSSPDRETLAAPGTAS